MYLTVLITQTSTFKIIQLSSNFKFHQKGFFHYLKEQIAEKFPKETYLNFFPLVINIKSGVHVFFPLSSKVSYLKAVKNQNNCGGIIKQHISIISLSIFVKLILFI